ncbi:hypothetical protein MtrunA17_Chr2g0328071 [Medicago truncatula]|nr:hypothetical protein MtrunA17_Chr2g0328071 [Medicago truncatula]
MQLWLFCWYSAAAASVFLLQFAALKWVFSFAGLVFSLLFVLLVGGVGGASLCAVRLKVDPWKVRMYGVDAMGWFLKGFLFEPEFVWQPISPLYFSTRAY